MAWTKYQILIAILMVFTGSINTIATKWADIVTSIGRDGVERKFNHPYVQALAMFLGEFCCLITFKLLYVYYKRKGANEEELPVSIAGSRNYNPLIFWLPALCDMIASSTMYVGLTMTYASSYQMLRGALIIFTGLFSVAFLRRHLKSYQWIGIFVVISGLIVVGLSDVLSPSKAIDPRKVITGDLLIIMAQIMTATQMVIEEKFVIGSNVSPLEAVGWEGLFGFITLALILIPMNYIYVGNMIFKNPGGQIEDAIDAFIQIKNNWQIMASLLGTVVSIAFFNFAGITVTKQLSATTRTVLDSVRTLFIWVFSLAIGWLKFNVYQLIVLVGFCLLISGMFLYNDVIIRPFLIRKGLLRNRKDSEQQPISGSQSRNNESPDA